MQSLSPGVVNTDIALSGGYKNIDNLENAVKDFTSEKPSLKPENVAQCVMFF